MSPIVKFHLFESIIQPILLYGSDIWGAFTQCTKDINSVFMWFIRGVLRVKPTTCNIITIGESGMIPPSIKCHESVILNFIRMQCMPKGSVVKSVFDELQLLDSLGFQCWYTRVIELGKTFDIDLQSYSYSKATKNNVRRKIQNHFIHNWTTDLNNLQKYPILRTYLVIKRSFGCEQHLKLVKNV